MLKIHVVHEGGHRYYVDDLVPGRAEGTLVAGEERGRWSGTGAASLGLVGEVETEPFAELLAGRHPVSGQTLRRRVGEHPVAGYDLSFCAPKSVSILHLLAPREIAAETGAGHVAAVREAAGYLEREALRTRRQQGGRVELLATTGATAGGFLHRTSRALDPHLHTHLVLANVAQAVDGRWSAVDGRRIHAHLAAAQGVYHARLRLELAERLGAAWEVGESGLGDVVGVGATVRHLFSQRSADMARYRFDRGRHPGDPRRGDGAFHATRPDKEAGRTVEDLRSEWRQRAASFGLDLGSLTRVVGLGRRDSSEVVDPERAGSRLRVAALEDRWLTRRDLVAVLAASATGGARAATLEGLADTMTATVPEDLRVADRSPSTGPVLGRSTADRRWRATALRQALDRGIEPSGPEPEGRHRLGDPRAGPPLPRRAPEREQRLSLGAGRFEARDPVPRRRAPGSLER